MFRSFLEHFSPRVALVALFAGALAVSSGCSSEPKGPSRKAAAVESFKATRGRIDDATKQVQATNDSLRALTAGGTGDMRPLFNKYSENVRKTQNMANDARDRSNAMREKTDEYVSEWQTELSKISDESLRAKSQQRAAAAKTEFEKVRSIAQDARAAYDPYMQGLEDIQQYLANDLTAGGIDSIKTKANDTLRKGDELQRRLGDVGAQLDTVSQQWSSNVGGSPK
jgi:hypothetical protein